MIRTSATPSQPLSAEDAVISILAASPHHEMRGKKRFHKTTFFCVYCSASIAVRFSIRNFGVFSGEIQSALDILTTFGDLKVREEQIGPNGFFTTVYMLPQRHRHKPDPVIAKVVESLAEYSTPSLEVASTVAYFMSQGRSEHDAIDETKRIKPDISTPAQFAKTRILLKGLAGLRASANGQRPKNP